MKISRREEEILNILWKKKKAFIKEIIEELSEDPKPPYNTISSVTRRLVEKRLVGYEAFGKTHRYFPIIKKAEITKMQSEYLLENYFNNSFKNMVSYFVGKNMGNISTLEEILKEIKDSEE